jgi:hypothetical protein
VRLSASLTCDLTKTCARPFATFLARTRFGVLGMRHPVITIADKRSARFADIANNRLQLIEYDAKILWGEQHALAVDHILDTLLVVPAGTRAACAEPEPWSGQTLGAQVIGKVQIPNAKEVFWEIVSVDQHGTPITQRRKASNKRPRSKSMPTAPGMSRSVSGVPAFIDPRASRAELAQQMTVPWIKNALYWDFHSPAEGR